MCVCQEQVPLSAPRKLLAHGTALVQRLDRALGCRMAELITKACFLLPHCGRNLPSATGQTDMGSLGNGVLRVNITSILSSATCKEAWRGLVSSYLKTDLFDPTEGSQSGEGD